MAWEKINEMFPRGGLYISDNQWLSNEEILNSDLDYIDAIYYKRIRSSLENEEHMVYYPNGDMDRYYTYMALPYNPVGGVSLFNAYGSKIHKRYLEEHA